MTGSIKKLKENYGFIRGTDGQEYFFHQNDCMGRGFTDLDEGAAVEFTPVESPKPGKGPRAEGVRVK